MAWRKVHFGEEVWEWQISKSSADDDGTPQVVIRAPSKVVTTIIWDRWETVRDGRGGTYKLFVEITPGTVKAHIKRNRAVLMAKPEKRRKREKGG